LCRAAFQACARPHQRRLADAIKKARNIALLPFAAQF